ncbi:MAG: glycosyltransferase family 2 protein [Legionella sp.]|nr:MAG: glycosyltransferase family 2 protein [Legionella sp.]
MLSVIIITKNEEANLRRCLESICWADEIIIMDSGSTDKTLEIAKEFTDLVYSADWEGYGIQKQRALDKATGSWVLNIDADEVINDALKDSIRQAIATDNADAYRIPIRLHFYDKTLKFSWSPKNHIRLYKREGAAYTDKIVHEEILLPQSARIGKIKAAIEHHCIQDVSHALYKMNLYTTYSAKINIEKNKNPSLIKSILSSWWMFFRCYFIQGGFLEGKDGFLLAVLSAHGSFYRGVKVIYLDKELQ